jgi:Zn-dependent peptidase ImmA (M78 family)
MSLPAYKSKTTSTDASFQQTIVQLIAIARRPEEALDLLCEYYGVERPHLRMGLPSGTKKALGCYVHRDKTIYISSQEYLYDPYVLIHEFYHHLRHVGGKHRGTEKHARDFALAFLRTAQPASVSERSA